MGGSNSPAAACLTGKARFSGLFCAVVFCDQQLVGWSRPAYEAAVYPDHLSGRPLLAYLSLAADVVFGAGQGFQPHRAARMHFLGRDADFRAQAEDEAVGEAG